MKTRLDYRPQGEACEVPKLDIFQKPPNNTESKKSTSTNQEGPQLRDSFVTSSQFQ